MNKIIFLAICLFIPIGIFAQTFTIGDLKYKSIITNTVDVVGTESNYSSHIEIPATVNYNGKDYVVKYVGADAFKNCTNLISVDIPDWVVSIGNNAFANCSALETVTFGYSLEIIGYRAFSLCSSLTSVEFTGAVKTINTIGSYAFNECNSLTSISLPSSITSIGEGAFYNCNALTSIIIPNAINEIGNNTFYHCDNLNSITIGTSVQTIGDDAFVECRKLTQLTLPNSITRIGNGCFSLCTGLSSVSFGNSLESIGNYAFYACPLNVNLYLPSSLMSIGERAFMGAAGTNVYIGSSVSYIGESAFTSMPNLTSFTVSSFNNYFSDDQGVLWDKNKTKLLQCPSSKSIIEIPNTVISIEANSLSNCSNLTEVTIPNSVEEIGNYALAYCTGLTSITCNADTPPILGTNVFSNVSKSIPLNVPINSVNAYEAALQWTDFTINPIPTNVTDIDEFEVKIYIDSKNNKLIVNNAKPGHHIRIFDMSGAIVYSNEVMSQSEEISCTSFIKGIYIVQIYGSSYHRSEKIRVF